MAVRVSFWPRAAGLADGLSVTVVVRLPKDTVVVAAAEVLGLKVASP